MSLLRSKSKASPACAGSIAGYRRLHVKRAGAAHPENIVFKLKCPQHPSTLWFSRSAYAEHIGRVLPNGKVDAVGSVLELLEGELPPAGTQVIVNL